jgi:hypothetical protein
MISGSGSWKQLRLIRGVEEIFQQAFHQNIMGAEVYHQFVNYLGTEEL